MRAHIMFPSVDSIKIHFMFGRFILSEQYYYNRPSRRYIGYNGFRAKVLILVYSVVLALLMSLTLTNNMGIGDILNDTQIICFGIYLMVLFCINHHMRDYQCEFYSKIHQVDCIIKLSKFDGFNYKKYSRIIHASFAIIYIYTVASIIWIYVCLGHCDIQNYFMLRHIPFIVGFYKCNVIVSLFYLMKVRVRYLNKLLSEDFLDSLKLRRIRMVYEAIYDSKDTLEKLITPYTLSVFFGAISELTLQWINSILFVTKMKPTAKNIRIMTTDISFTNVLTICVLWYTGCGQSLVAETKRTGKILHSRFYRLKKDSEATVTLMHFSCRLLYSPLSVGFYVINLNLTLTVKVASYLLQLAVVGVQFELFKLFTMFED